MTAPITQPLSASWQQMRLPQVCNSAAAYRTPLYASNFDSAARLSFVKWQLALFVKTWAIYVHMSLVIVFFNNVKLAKKYLHTNVLRFFKFKKTLLIFHVFEMACRSFVSISLAVNLKNVIATPGSVIRTVHIWYISHFTSYMYLC